MSTLAPFSRYTMKLPSYADENSTDEKNIEKSSTTSESVVEICPNTCPSQIQGWDQTVDGKIFRSSLVISFSITCFQNYSIPISPSSREDSLRYNNCIEHEKESSYQLVSQLVLCKNQNHYTRFLPMGWCKNQAHLPKLIKQSTI